MKTQSLVLDFIIRNVWIFPIQVLSSSHLQREKNYVVSSHGDFVWKKMADLSGTLILNEKNNRNPLFLDFISRETCQVTYSFFLIKSVCEHLI